MRWLFSQRAKIPLGHAGIVNVADIQPFGRVYD
jgi:hypothetical protein